MFDSSAYCGLFCEACPMYIETKANPATESPCGGCRSDVLCGWCKVCSIKTCAKDKGHDFCIECADYPCQVLVDFKEDSEYPYHDDVFEHLEMIAEVGEEKWRQAMDKKYRDADGNWIDWYEELKQRKA